MAKESSPGEHLFPSLIADSISSRLSSRSDAVIVSRDHSLAKRVKREGWERVIFIIVKAKTYNWN